jgi:AraC-like DNA-binding protein
MAFWCWDYPLDELPQLTHAGHCDTETGVRFGIHTHLGYEIVYIKRGHGMIQVLPGKAPIECVADDVMVTAPGLEHQFVIGESDIELFWVGIQTRHVVGITKNHILPPKHLLTRTPKSVEYLESTAEFRALEDLGNNLDVESFVRIRHAPEFFSPIFDIVSEVHTYRPYRSYLVFGAMLSIIALLNRRVDRTDGWTTRSEAVQYTAEFVGAHWNESVSLTEIARRVGLHPSHLSRMFHRETGRLFRKYLTSVRMRNAKRYLVNGDSVGTVAWKCGFSSIYAFSRTFHRETGLAPSAYRGSLTTPSDVPNADAVVRLMERQTNIISR